MPNLRAQVTIAMTSGVAKDAAQNVWHFQSALATTPYTLITTALQTFYRAIEGIFPDTVSQGGHRVRIYDLADPEPRAPVHDATFTLNSAPSGTQLPSECAVVLSFQGTRVSGQSQARRRGRVYLGPLDQAQLSSGRISAGTITTITTAASALLSSSTAAADWDWVVRSQVGATNVFVTNGWVDNAVDIQRRRGLEPTVRTTWT